MVMAPIHIQTKKNFYSSTKYFSIFDILSQPNIWSANFLIHCWVPRQSKRRLLFPSTPYISLIWICLEAFSCKEEQSLYIWKIHISLLHTFHYFWLTYSVLFCSIESEGDDANIFVSVFCFYLFDYFGSSKLIFTWLKTSRLLWQLWKGVQSTRTAVLSQIVFFWMNNLMMKFKSFCLLDAYCGRGSTHSVTHAHSRAGHLR